MPGSAEVNQNLNKHINSKIDQLASKASQHAQALETYAKANAPWTDRTGDARNQLTGSSEVNSKEIVVVLAQMPYYGVYLERDHGGRFAILDPTMNALTPGMFQEYQRIWNSN